MDVKRILVPVILFIFICYSCKKNNNNVVTPTSTIANIDSITGSYYGTTTGDSLFSYKDSTGVMHQWVHSFTWADTLQVTSSDTLNITVVSKFYTITFPYYDSLTLYPLTYLTIGTPGQGANGSYNASLTDTTDLINHLVVNVWYGYNKQYTSNVLLYKR